MAGFARYFWSKTIYYKSSCQDPQNILDGHIYNDEYDTVEKNLIDCDVGGRNETNTRDNILV